MLKKLPIILSQISQNFDPLFLFYSHIITYLKLSSFSDTLILAILVSALQIAKFNTR